MGQIINVEYWEKANRGSFDVELYAKRLKLADISMNVYRIKYKYYKSSKTMSQPLTAIEYVQAGSKDGAIQTWGKWSELIISIEEICGEK